MKGKIHENKMFSVLLADDDEDDRLLFTMAFEALNMDIQVDTVTNGAEAIDYLQSAEHLPQVLFLDLNMPVMDGMTCLAKITTDERYRNMCVAIYSTTSSEKEISKTLVLGAHAFIKKPDDFEKLKKVLAKVISLNSQYADSFLNREFFRMSL